MNAKLKCGSRLEEVSEPFEHRDSLARGLRALEPRK